MAVSPDGSRVAVSRHRMYSTDLELWSTGETPRIMRRLPTQGGLHVGFVDDNHLLIQRFSIEKLSEPVVLWDLNSWKPLWQFPVSNFPSKVECGGGRFAIDEGGTVTVFDGDDYRQKLSATSGQRARLSPNGKFLAIEDLNGWRCVNVDTGADVLAVEDTRGGCFSTDGQMFVCGLSRGGLATFDLDADAQGAVKSNGLAGSFYTDQLTATDDGIVFLDFGDDYLKIWEDKRSSARTLFPKKFHDVKIVPVANSHVWISQPGGYLSSLDLATGQLKPLQPVLRGYASSLWLVWCVAWLVARFWQANMSPAATSLLGGPALDLSVTLLPVVAYFTIMSNAGMWLTGWDMEIALAGAVTMANFGLLWLVLGHGRITARLLCAFAGLGVLTAGTVAQRVGLLALGGVVVGMLPAALIWWLYRWRAAWRLAPQGVNEAGPKSKRLHWTIRNLLVLTAGSAVLIRVAVQVDFKQLLFGDYFDPSIQWMPALIVFLHAVVPIILCFAPWSPIKRLVVLGVLLVVYWQIWQSDWARLASHLALMSLVVCGILWLHGYRVIRARPVVS